MQIIQLRHPYEPSQTPNKEVVMVLGFFDGIRKGHRKVTETSKKIAEEKGLKLAVMTFNRYPSIVFQKVLSGNMKYLASLEREERLVANLGADILYIVGFTSMFAQLKPQDFVDQYIISSDSVVAASGFNYTCSPKEITGVKQLPTYTRGRFEVVTVPKEEMTGAKAGSTGVHEKMEAGEMEEVTRLLGYIYGAKGIVVHGDARDHLLGFPTASIKVKSTIRLPRVDVYAVQIEVGGRWYVGMGSIGHNDTFGEGHDLAVEVYILDFHQDIYGGQVVACQSYYLRDQVKFSGAGALIDQLKRDERGTAGYFQRFEDR